MVLFTIATLLLAAKCECLFFNDGHLEIEDPLINFEEEDSTLPHFSFDRDQIRNLRDFLNSSKITDFLEQ